MPTKTYAVFYEQEVSSLPKLTETEFRAWRGFLHAHDAIFKALDEDLRREFGLSMPAYELLVTLEGEAGGVRMSVLARTLRFSGGGLTRLVDRLEQAGFVTRERCEEDGRGFEVSLTDEGKLRLRRVHASHIRAVRELFLSRTTPAEQRILADVWDRLKQPSEIGKAGAQQ